HCLVIPRAEVDHWIDLAPEEGAHLMEVAGHVGRAQHEAFVCGRIGMLIAGFEVPHTHVHVVPIDDMGDLDFRNADPSVDAAELDRVADRLRQQLSDHGHGEAVGRATA
ncbi:MAG: HIT family protein, partial [Actinomycetia bacterium]|nr:HIT family protein [Actinomycetes bacterium]